MTYRFNIVNLMKPDSTYNLGMKPVVYSVKDAEKTGIGWQRGGFNIAYYQNSRKRKVPQNEKGANSGISTTSTSISGASNNNQN